MAPAAGNMVLPGSAADQAKWLDARIERARPRDRRPVRPVAARRATDGAAVVRLALSAQRGFVGTHARHRGLAAGVRAVVHHNGKASRHVGRNIGSTCSHARPAGSPRSLSTDCPVRLCENARMERLARAVLPGGFTARSCVLALVSTGLAACSGSGQASSRAVDGGSGGSRAGSNGCGASTCVVSTPTCGIYSNACGDVVDCGICSFATASGPIQASSFSLATTADGTVEVAYSRPGDGVNIAHFSNGVWTDEVALTTDLAMFPGQLRLAIAPDGTRWLSFIAGFTSLVVAHAPEGGPWTDDGVVATTPVGSLAVANDGTPFLVYAVVAPPGGIFVSTGVGAMTPEQVVAGASSSSRVAIGVAGTQPMIAYTSNSGTVSFAQRDPTGWITAPLSSNGYGVNALELAVSRHGDPAVAIAGDNLEVYRRSGATWSVSTIANPNAQSVAAAFDANDGLWFAASGSEIYLGNLAPNATPIQRIHRYCSGVGVSLTFDTAGNLQIVDECHGLLEAHTRQGTVSADYTATCNEIKSSLCTQACNCTGIANCCYFPGSASWCSGTRTGCEYDLTLHMCGDVEVSAATLSTCQAALPQATCATQSNEKGAALPAVCSALY